MSKVGFISVYLEDIIDFTKSSTNGSWFTKTLINDNKGNIPVYGASNIEFEVGYGYVKDNLILKKNGKTKKVKYFEDCLTWNIDGSPAIFYRKNRFSLSEKVIPLIPFDELKSILSLEYVLYSILNSKEIEQFGFSNKAGKEKLKKLMIKIPVLEDGRYDLVTQNEIVKKYKIIYEKKKILEKKIEELTNISVIFSDKYNVKNIKITDLFTPTLGSGTYTKDYCLKNIGKYPVYSGQINGHFSEILNYDYEGTYLTWAKDGLAGFIMYHENEKFSITNHRGILIPTDKCKNIDLKYIKYVLEPIFRRNLKGRLANGEKNEYTTLSKDMIKGIKELIPIPVKEDGCFDLIAQKEIAKKYEMVNNIKECIANNINEIISTNIVFNN